MSLSRAAILTLFVPFALAAQQPAPAGPPANPITTAFKGRIGGLQHNLAQAFDSIPESKFGYKPTEKQLTIGYIAQHLAEDNYLFCNAFGDMKATVSDEDKTTPDSVKATWPKEKLVTKLKASFAFCDQAIAQVTDTNLADQAELTMNGNTRKIGRSSMVLGHALDLADHYSQIANYMRLNGILPPTALPRPGRGGK